MSRYTLVPQVDEKTKEVICYLFQVNEDRPAHWIEGKNVCFGKPFLFAGRDFLKIRNPEDAITVLNYLNETDKNER